MQIAGLCHDLGHGPFSHMFEHVVNEKRSADAKPWRHEDASVDMFRHMIDTNNLRPEFAKVGLFEIDIQFICEQISGKPWSECGDGGGSGGGAAASAADTPPPSQSVAGAAAAAAAAAASAAYTAGGTNSGTWPFTGRPEGKRYLYEIVNNPRNGVDVDKWDYFARDCKNCGVSCSFDHDRYMKTLRVCEDFATGELMICPREKEVRDISPLPIHFVFC